MVSKREAARTFRSETTCKVSQTLHDIACCLIVICIIYIASQLKTEHFGEVKYSPFLKLGAKICIIQGLVGNITESFCHCLPNRTSKVIVTMSCNNVQTPCIILPSMRVHSPWSRMMLEAVLFVFVK